MAQGDHWEISFAAPIPNYRFTEWNPTISDGPVGWNCENPAGWSLDIAVGALVGAGGPPCAAKFTTSTSQRYFKTTLPDRSFPSYSIESKLSFRYYSALNFTADVDWRELGGASQGLNVYSPAATPGTWGHYVGNAETHAGVSGARIRFWCSTAVWTLYLSEVVLRWAPSQWDALGYGFSTLDSYPVADGLYYGPFYTGSYERGADGTARPVGIGARPDKWILRASYEDMSEADYLTLQRYYMGSVGMLDGIPRPVAARPYLVDQSNLKGPEILVGFFTSALDFSRSSLSGTYSGEIVIEEM
jgi:hypothetical protein